jgi:transcriptional regulator with XRE-family HTH domain
MLDKKSDIQQAEEIRKRLRNLRQRCHLSMRQLAEQAGVAASYVAGVEAGRISPTIATFRKLLTVLGTDMGEFFSDEFMEQDGHIFRRENMRTVVDSGRCYTFILPRRSDLKAEVLDEEYMSGENPEFEALPSDLIGYLLRGEFTLEVQGEPPQVLRTGDAFCIPPGKAARGYCTTDEHARVISILIPPTY